MSLLFAGYSGFAAGFVDDGFAAGFVDDGFVADFVGTDCLMSGENNCLRNFRYLNLRQNHHRNLSFA